MAVSLTKPRITLEVHICDQRRSYLAEFATEAQALDFIERKSSTHAFHVVEDDPPAECYRRLWETLHPTCYHGLSADLCWGPGHYPPDNSPWL